MHAVYKQMALRDDLEFLSAPTGKPLPVATSARLEGPGAFSMLSHCSLPACIASLDPPCDVCSPVRFVLPRQRLLVSQQRVLPAQDAAHFANGHHHRAPRQQDCHWRHW